MDSEKDIAYWRCHNKPVIFKAKTLNISCDEVRRIINSWKEETRDFIFSLKEHDLGFFNPDITGLLKSSDLSVEYARKILSNKFVINYIVLNRERKHDRYMDCIRYHVKILLQGK
jgi:hypothetical protein